MQKKFELWRFSGWFEISLRLPFVGNAYDRGAKHFPCYINTMEDEFEVASFSCNDIGSVKGNQHISQINPIHWSVILRDHVWTVDLDILLLCQVVFFDGVGAFDSCKTWPNNNTFVVKPFQQMCPGIVVRPTVKRTTTVFLQIPFGHQWAFTKANWVKGGNW